MTYAVIVCPRCNTAKIVDTSKRTTTCFTCKKHITLEKQTFLYETNTLEKAQQALGLVNAEKDGKKEEFKVFLRTKNK
jgi:transposase-like protein